MILIVYVECFIYLNSYKQICLMKTFLSILNFLVSLF